MKRHCPRLIAVLSALFLLCAFSALASTATSYWFTDSEWRMIQSDLSFADKTPDDDLRALELYLEAADPDTDIWDAFDSVSKYVRASAKGASLALSTLSQKTASEENHFIVNKNRKTFHLTTCVSVNDIKRENRIDFTGSRDDAIAAGYKPCKRCNP